MSFSYADEDNNFSFASHLPKGFFPDFDSYISPKRWQLIFGIMKFFKRSREKLNHLDERTTLACFCRDEKISPLVIDHYVIPMVSAIWSIPFYKASHFPAKSILSFFNNHGLLSAFDQPQWKTLVGGSHSYVKKMVEPFKDKILTNTPVVKVILENQKPVVIDHQGNRYEVDEVIFACHSNQALMLCHDLTNDQKEVLSSISYQDNIVHLHQDKSLMPQQKSSWASWNVIQKNKQVFTTYWMNSLQKIPQEFQIFVSLNYQGDINNVLKELHYAHPVFDQAAILAQERAPSIQGQHHFWFCGAYLRYGFHEDGMHSAIQMLHAMGEKLW